LDTNRRVLDLVGSDWKIKHKLLADFSGIEHVGSSRRTLPKRSHSAQM